MRGLLVDCVGSEGHSRIVNNPETQINPETQTKTKIKSDTIYTIDLIGLDLRVTPG